MAGQSRRKRIVIRVAGGLGLLLAALVGAGYVLLKPAPNPAPQVADYGSKANWVCLPGRNDICAADLGATAIAADGGTQVNASTPTGDPPVDCFYVYPTVSRDPTENARLTLAPEVEFVTRVQFARFRTVCRPYAPLYRQGTLKALKAAALGIGTRGDLDLAYGDVRNAWQTYLAKYNNGRGVVLIGHSQGSRMLKRLMQEQIEHHPAQSQLVSALLLGNSVIVPTGKDTGGDFQTIRLCRAPTQIGCVVAYSSFRASAPPPSDSRYGRDPGNGQQVGCTNPAALGGGKAALDSYFVTREDSADRPYTDPPVTIGTPFVTLPGLISGACVHDDHGTYLSISLNGHPGDRRRAELYGDVIVFGRVLPGWGLHLIDMSLTQGDLVKLVQSQAQAFATSRHVP